MRWLLALFGHAGWQGHAESAPVMEGAFNPDISTVHLNDATADSKSNPFCFGFLVIVADYLVLRKDSFELFRGNTQALVAHADDDMMGSNVSGYRDRAACW